MDKFVKSFYFLLILLLVQSCSRGPATPPETPSEVAMKYIQAVKNDDMKSAVNCWTAKEAKTKIPFFKKRVQQAALAFVFVIEKEMAKDSEYQVIKENIEGEVANLVIERNFLPQKKVTQTKVRLIIDKGEWKISQWGG